MITIGINNPDTAFMDVKHSSNIANDIAIACPECGAETVSFLKCTPHKEEEGALLQFRCTSCHNQFGIDIVSHAGFTGLRTNFITKDRYMEF